MTGRKIDLPTPPIGLKMNFGTIFVLVLICKNICAVPLAHTDLPALETDGGSATSIVEPTDAGEEEDLVEVQKTVDEELVNSINEANYFEGDILLTKNQQAAIEQDTGVPVDPNEPQRAITRLNDLWVNRRVPYVISSKLSSKAKNAIQQAINEYSSKTCIQFTKRGSERDYVYFFRGSGCYSYVGRVGGGQAISIGYGCEYKGIVIHEIFHALGRWHEQSRPDRDQFVTINYNNIRNGVQSNFFKLSSSHAKIQGLTYDYRSIMHYSAYAFSKNGRATIEPKDRSISRNTLGQRQGFSSTDLRHVNVLYCNNEPLASWSSWGALSSCSRTCNGGTQTRRRSCVGGASCPGTNIQTVNCNTQSCPVPASWSFWSQWSGCSVSCGGGRRSRTRQCQNGNSCTGPSAQYSSCNTQACPVPDGIWNTWSAWTQCSVACGGGTQTRRRTCSSQKCVGSTVGTRDCNTGSCIKHKGCYQLLSNVKLFLLEGRASVLDGRASVRKDPVKKCAEATTLFGYSVFSVANGYCISGNNKLSDYTKVPSNKCKDGKGAYTRTSRFSMDVYTISDPRQFTSQDNPLVSSDAIMNDLEQTPNSGGSSASLPSSVLLTLALVVSLTFTILQHMNI